MRRRPRLTSTGWSSYVGSFHRERAGITESVLRRSRAGGVDPYEWLASPLGEFAGTVLDVGAGSGPMASLLDGWVGIDRSIEELAVARSSERGAVACGVADALPVRDAGAGAAVLAMSLQVLEPIDAVMAELGRVVRPGGQVAVLLPARSPLPLRDVLLYWRLQRRLGQSITYPNDTMLRGDGLRRLARSAGFDVRGDEREAFELPLADRAAAEELVASLYLPGVDERRLAGAVDLVMSRVGRSVAIPLRRVVLRRSGGED
jgi:SAM-dependent methyltransferase